MLNQGNHELVCCISDSRMPCYSDTHTDVQLLRCVWRGLDCSRARHLWFESRWLSSKLSEDNEDIFCVLYSGQLLAMWDIYSTQCWQRLLSSQLTSCISYAWGGFWGLWFRDSTFEAHCRIRAICNNLFESTRCYQDPLRPLDLVGKSIGRSDSEEEIERMKDKEKVFWDRELGLPLNNSPSQTLQDVRSNLIDS